jgi:hypothetical protein
MDTNRESSKKGRVMDEAMTLFDYPIILPKVSFGQKERWRMG